MALLIKIYPDNPNERQMKTVVECLRDGGIVVYPTDTIYGMGCDIFKSKTVERICELRGIKPGKATFSFICADLSQLADYTKPIENLYGACHMGDAIIISHEEIDRSCAFRVAVRCGPRAPARWSCM